MIQWKLVGRASYKAPYLASHVNVGLFLTLLGERYDQCIKSLCAHEQRHYGTGIS